MSLLRPLGATGAQVSALGFGVSGPHGTALVPPKETVRLIRQAFEGGATLFDTAPFYGDGECERRLGAALKTLPRDKVFLCTKAGSVRSGFRRISKDFSPKALRSSLEGSLQRLGVDHVDAFLLHGPDPKVFTDALFAELERMKREGLIRFTGVCGRGGELADAINSGGFDLVMGPVNQDCAHRAGLWIEAAKARGMGVLGIEAMKPAMHRFRIPTKLADLWYLARGLISRAARPLEADAALTPVTTARAPMEMLVTPAAHLQWAIQQGGADCALVTTTRAAHLKSNLDAARSAVSA